MAFTKNSSMIFDILAIIGVLAGLLLLCNIGRELLWYGVLALLWAFMILLPAAGIVILILVLTDKSQTDGLKKTLLTLASAVLILAGPLNHTLVRSPLNVFNPYGRAKVDKTPGHKTQSVFVPYKHTALDKAVIKGLNLEEKGIRIYAWTQHLTVEDVLSGKRNPKETISNIRHDIYQINRREVSTGR